MIQHRKLRTVSMALALAASLAWPAQPQAQSSSGYVGFAGQFVFQTSDLRPGPDFEILSGFAESEELSDGTYEILLFATDYIQDDRGQRRFYATQSCTGQWQGQDLHITCEVERTTGQNYRPDNFIVRPVPNQGVQWTGTTGPAGSGYVEFINMD